jgi:phenylacetate-CoA ligase
MQMTETQLNQIKTQLKRVMQVPGGFYAVKFAGIDIDAIKTQSDFEKLPFSSKQDLRGTYPLGLSAVPEEKIVRIHSSSGTTGTPVIIPYTQKDIDDWSTMFARCYTTAGMTNRDRIQITPGYGLWTAGIGFQLGAEKMGAMTIPMGPGNTDKQIRMMIDLKATVLGATSSYALLLAEEIEKRGLRSQICLKKGIIGSERWGEKMRQRIKNVFAIELYDIYGLTEVYGPGIGINCPGGEGIHLWDDYIYCEILDPQTGNPVPDGELGEICLTTLVKEGAPLFRFRTHDLASFIPGRCPHCTLRYPRISAIMGRSDDMVKVKGCILFPSTIEEVIKDIPGTSSEYRAEISHIDGHDEMTIFVEVENGVDRAEVAITTAYHFKERTNMTPQVKVVGIGDLPRSEKKTKRIIDHRFENN